MTLLVAHAGNWLAGLGFVAAPLAVVAAVVAIAVADRRRGPHANR